MSELEMLLAQKKQIEEKIKALQNESVVIGRVKFEKRHYRGGKADTYFICVQSPAIYRYKGKKFDTNRWNPLLNSEDKTEAISSLEEVIGDLKDLLALVKGDGSGTDS